MPIGPFLIFEPFSFSSHLLLDILTMAMLLFDFKEVLSLGLVTLPLPSVFVSSVYTSPIHPNAFCGPLSLGYNALLLFPLFMIEWETRFDQMLPSSSRSSPTNNFDAARWWTVNVCGTETRRISNQNHGKGEYFISNPAEPSSSLMMRGRRLFFLSLSPSQNSTLHQLTIKYHKRKPTVAVVIKKRGKGGGAV